MRKALTAFALVALAVPATARATHWDYERQPIPEGQTLKIASSSNPSAPLKLRWAQARQTGVIFTCAISGIEAFWNVPGMGLDETKSITFNCTAPCGKVSIKPSLPWTSTLEGTVQPPTDRWERVSLHLTCGATDYGSFSGTLTPLVGDGDPQGPEHPDDLDNEMRFTPTGTDLTGPNGGTLSWVGIYKLGGKGHGVTGEL